MSNAYVFSYLAIFIVAVGSFELSRLFVKSKFQNLLFFALSLVIYFILSAGLFFLSLAERDLILLTFLILSIFDSFSQITGQLFGKTKIMPDISPNKTLGGVVGGTIISLVSAFLLKSLFSVQFLNYFCLLLELFFSHLLETFLRRFTKENFKLKITATGYPDMVVFSIGLIV